MKARFAPILIVISLLIAFVAVPYLRALANPAPPFPFHSYAEVPASPAGSACEGTVGVFVADGWTIFSSQDRDIYVHTSEDGKADYVYFAKGTSTEGVIHITRVMTVDEANRLYPGGPCAYFTEQQAQR